MYYVPPGMVTEDIRPIFAPPDFFRIPSVVSPLGAIENLWENGPTEGNAYNLVVCSTHATKLKTLKAAYRRLQMLRMS